MAAGLLGRERHRHDRAASLGHPGRPGIEAFLAIGVAGLAGCLIGGWAADRLGRAATAAAALAVSGACCLLSPLSFTASRPWLLGFAAVWGPPSSPTPAYSPPC
jgi:predicted MFS family arabinose efflux permease